VRIDIAMTHWNKGLLRKAFDTNVTIPNSHLEVAKVLHGAGRQELLMVTDNCDISGLGYATSYCSVEIAKALLDAGGSEFYMTIYETGQNYLHIAVHLKFV